MGKFFIFALAVVLVLALVGGLVLADGMKQAYTSPAVVTQIAAQEAAKANQLQAQAAVEWVKVDEEKAKADSARAAASADWARAEGEQTRQIAQGRIESAKADKAEAWSSSSVILADELGRGWGALVLVLAVAATLLAVGSSASWVRWSWGRAAVVPLPGGLFALRQDRAVIVFDPARMIGGVVQLEAGGVLPVLQTSEELAADVARAALVADAVKHVGGSESRAEIAAKVSESLSSAFSNLAGAVSAPMQSPAVAAGAPALRLVKLRSPAEKAKAEAVNDTAELREFVEVGAAVGFQRSKWAGYKFKSTGRACSQTRWSVLAGWLRESELLDGSALVCSSSEALQRLGYDDAGDNAGESESEK